MSTDQLATRAIDALAAVRAIEPDNSHPMRHVARGLKREAESLLADAFTRAYGLAILAQQATDDYDRATKKAGAAC